MHGLFFVIALLPMLRADDGLAAEVGTLVRPRIEAGRSVGIVVGVVRDGRSEVFGFGRPSIEDDEPPDGRTVFEIGSISKVFTAIALADMAREGLVALDDPVASLLPEGTRVPDHDGHAITLRTLANHTSGLPTLIPKVLARAVAGKDPYADVSPRDLYDFLATARINRDPGSKYAYSNLGAGLLGTALARRAGMGYEDLVLTRICRPLGMADTRVTLDPEQSIRLAHPYTKQGKAAIYWTLDAFAGAGALRSTADDLLKFARANLGLGPSPDRLRAAMDEARTPRTPTGHDGLKIGLGWHVFEANDKAKRPETTWHNGGTGGFRSFLAMVRETSLAVVVLSNSDDSVDDLGLAMIDLLARRRGAAR
jgi:D-alanyl-D-alanine-carboxypeptidase/D-alanyl-D-alanine-endopeptidase